MGVLIEDSGVSLAPEDVANAWAYRMLSIVRSNRWWLLLVMMAMGQAQASASSALVIAVDGSQSAESLSSVHYTINQILSDDTHAGESHLIVYTQVVEQVVSLGSDPSLMRSRVGELMRALNEQAAQLAHGEEPQLGEEVSGGRPAIALERALAVFDEQQSGGIVVFNSAAGIAGLSVEDAQWLDIVLLPDMVGSNRHWVLVSDAAVEMDTLMARARQGQYANPLVLSPEGENVDQLIKLLFPPSEVRSNASTVAVLTVQQPAPSEAAAAKPLLDDRSSDKPGSTTRSDAEVVSSTTSNSTAPQSTGNELVGGVSTTTQPEQSVLAPDEPFRITAEALATLAVVVIAGMGWFVWAAFRRRKTFENTAAAIPACPIEDESASYLPLDRSMPRHFGQSAIDSAGDRPSPMDTTAQQADTVINDDDKTVLKPRS